MQSIISPISPVRGLDRFPAVARDLSELKRLRDQSTTDSVAERLFRRAWGQIASGAPPASVWAPIVADALVATRLGGIDAALLKNLGLERPARTQILTNSFNDATSALSANAIEAVRAAIGGIDWTGVELHAPVFADELIRQPRAGATSPGKPRLTLEPAESHGDHCLVVAVLGALIALHAGGDPARVFLAGLAHHLHNAILPDTGFAGEVMLGASLEPILRRLFARELATLAPDPRAHVEKALLVIADADTAEGRAFNAADVIDRVLQAHHHARAAAFTADQALGDLELVHEGPLRPFHARVLAVMRLA